MIETLTAKELLDAHAAGTLKCGADDILLTVEPLADRSGPDCYPDTVLRLTWPGGELAIGCWWLGQYMKGPNRRDNGEYIGAGWHWQEDDSDGVGCGKPRVTTEGAAVLILSGDNVGGSHRIDAESGDEADLLAGVLGDLILDAYYTIDAKPAADDEVAGALRQGPADGTILDVEVYAGQDAGRPVFTFAGSDEVWEDAHEMMTALTVAVVARLRRIDAGHDEEANGLISRLERRANPGEE